MILLSKLDYANWLRIRQKDIAEELGMKPPHKKHPQPPHLLRVSV